MTWSNSSHNNNEMDRKWRVQNQLSASHSAASSAIDMFIFDRKFLV